MPNRELGIGLCASTDVAEDLKACFIVAYLSLSSCQNVTRSLHDVMMQIGQFGATA